MTNFNSSRTNEFLPKAEVMYISISAIINHLTDTINHDIDRLQNKNKLPSKLAVDMSFAELKSLLVGGNRILYGINEDRYVAMVISLARENTHPADYSGSQW